METSEILILGAGISGLVLARELSKKGKQVILLEARERTGGRIHTIENEFPIPAETGAEFIHGRLSNTIKLLKNYNIAFSRTKGEIWRLRNGVYKKNADFVDEHEHLLKRKLKELEEDISVQQFLEQNFPGEEFHTLYAEVKKFVEGYDTADFTRASTFEFRKEWDETKDWKQYRIEGGYSKLTDALEKECRMNGCVFHLSTEAKEIHWKKSEVEVVCADGRKFTGQKIIITASLGVLRSGAIKFSPSLQEKEDAIQQLGFGEIIKILLYFKEEFWKKKENRKRTGENLKKLFFMNSDAEIPTWWTQYPSEKPLITGWLSGPAVKAYMDMNEEQLLEKAIASLAFIFKESEDDLKNELLHWKINNWSKDAFSRGSYAYATVGAEKQIEILSAPVENTIFFAGELFAPESGTGLVEAAIASGLKTAKKIIAA
jgi:monoamine oxidase